MAAQRTRLAFDVDVELYKELKHLAAQKGMSLDEFCTLTLERRIQIEKTGYLSTETAPLLAELWDNEADAIYDDAQ
jgi:hypothetical protein